MRRAALIALAGAGLSCVAGMEARLRVEVGRASQTAQACATLGFDAAAPAADGGGLFGGGALDFRRELATQLEGLVGGIDAVEGELAATAGDAGKLGVAHRVRDEVAALRADLAGVTDDAAAELVRTTTALLDPLATAADGIEQIAADARGLAGCLADVKVSASLTLDAQAAAASATIQALTSCQVDLGGLRGRVDAVTDAIAGLEPALASARAAVDAALRGDQAVASRLASTVQLRVMELTTLVRAHARWLVEGRAVLGSLVSLASGGAQAALDQLGKRVLARQAGGVARAVFQVVRIVLAQVDHQLQRFADAGYGLGGLGVVFAAGQIDRVVERAGRDAGGLASRLGAGANAMMYEACRAVTADDGGGLAVLSMASFYRGFIAGYGGASGDGEVELGAHVDVSGGVTDATPSWWRAGLRAAAGGAAALPTDAATLGDGAITPVQADLLADWSALYAEQQRGAWGPAPTPTDRRDLRLAYVLTLMSSPELVGGAPSGGAAGASARATMSYVDQRLIQVFAGTSSAPSGTPAGSAPAVAGDGGTVVHQLDTGGLETAVRDLTTDVRNLETAHRELIDELTVQERHWRSTQLITAICQSVEGSRTLKAEGVTCAERDKDDAVTTLVLTPPDHYPSGEWGPIDLDRRRDAAKAHACKGAPHCTDLTAWAARAPRKKRGRALPNDVIARVEAAAGALALRVKTRHKYLRALDGNAAADPPRIIVTGQASSRSISCEQLAIRLLTQTALPTCPVEHGARGVTLCHETSWDHLDAPVLATGDDRLTCGAGHDANELLAILRGWAIRDVIAGKLPTSWAKTIQFEDEPLPATGTCTAKANQECEGHQLVEVQVLAQ